MVLLSEHLVEYVFCQMLSTGTDIYTSIGIGTSLLQPVTTSNQKKLEKMPVQAKDLTHPKPQY